MLSQLTISCSAFTAMLIKKILVGTISSGFARQILQKRHLPSIATGGTS